MITFVLYDDIKEFNDKTHALIDKVLKDTETKYQIKIFNKYNKELEKLITEDKTKKIYILDIEIPDSISGIELAKRIRKQDWESSITLVTSHVELGYEALKAQIMLLDFICKYNDWKTNLTKVIKIAIKQINNMKVIKFESSGITHRVYTDDILYVRRDSIDRKCIIKTTYNEFQINKSITEMGSYLDSRFYMAHRSCYVNTEQIRKIDWRNSIIYFNNGDTTDYLSRDKKKGLKEYVRSN